jgi:hypothetical protein
MSTHGVDQDVATVDPLVLRGVAEEGRVLGGEVGEVEAGSRKEVLGLSNIHPEAGEVERVKLVVGSNGGEDLLLDRGGAELRGQHIVRIDDEQG